MPTLPLASSLKAFFARFDRKALAVEDWPSALFGGATLAGPSINAISAMRVPAVSSAVELISQLVGTLPAKLFARAADGSRTPDAENPAYRLVHDEANDWTSATALRTQLTADALLNDSGGFAHSTVKTTERYAHVAPSMLRVAIDLLNPKTQHQPFGQLVGNQWNAVQANGTNTQAAQAQIEAPLCGE